MGGLIQFKLSHHHQNQNLNHFLCVAIQLHFCLSLCVLMLISDPLPSPPLLIIVAKFIHIEELVETREYG